MGFKKAMDEHRIASGGGKAMGEMGGGDVAVYSEILDNLVKAGKMTRRGVKFDPYTRLKVEGEVLAIIQDGQPVDEVAEGEEAEVLLPETCFYVESGGQVTDQWKITSHGWWQSKFEVQEMRKPAAGIIVHCGKVTKGTLKVGQMVIAQVDAARRQDIRRNHTATHLLHAELHKVDWETRVTGRFHGFPGPLAIRFQSL